VVSSRGGGAPRSQPALTLSHMRESATATARGQNRRSVSRIPTSLEIQRSVGGRFVYGDSPCRSRNEKKSGKPSPSRWGVLVGKKREELLVIKNLEITYRVQAKERQKNPVLLSGENPANVRAPQLSCETPGSPPAKMTEESGEFCQSLRARFFKGLKRANSSTGRPKI